MGEKAAYALAVKNCYVADAVANIQRRYLRRFPIEMDKNVDPTPEQLAAVNDNEAEAEPTEPDPTTMTPSEFEAAIQQKERRSRMLEFRKAQIKRWLAYQYSKDNHNNGKEEGSNNPYNAMIPRLTGKTSSYPRAPTAVNIWRKTQRKEIERQLKVAILVGARSNQPISKERYAAERERIARELFGLLPIEDQKHWRDQAILDHCEAIRAYERELLEDPSTDPADRQRAIQGLTQFMQPILNLVCKATGWKATFIAGGPEPAHDGRLNVLSVHSGMTSGDIKMNFGRSERAAYKAQVIPVYGNFLKKCYSPEECRSRALPQELGYLPLSLLETNNETFSIHSVSTAPSALMVPSLAPSTEPISHPVPVLITPSFIINNVVTSTPSGNTPSAVSTNVVTSVLSGTVPIAAGSEVTADDNMEDDVNDNVDGIFPFDLASSPAASPPPSPPNSRACTPAPSTKSHPTGNIVTEAHILAEPTNTVDSDIPVPSNPVIPVIDQGNCNTPVILLLKDIQVPKAGQKRKAPPTPSSNAELKRIRTRSVAKTIMAEEENHKKMKAKGGRGKKGHAQHGNQQSKDENVASKDPKRLRVMPGRKARRA